MLGEHPVQIIERRGGHCSIPTASLTLHIYRRPKSEVIDSSIEFSSLPQSAVTLSRNLHTWLILKSRGEAWPESANGLPAQLLDDELVRISRALHIIRDDQQRIEALLWEAGYRDGYSSWG